MDSIDIVASIIGGILALAIVLLSIEGIIVSKRLYDANVCLEVAENPQICIDKFVELYVKEEKK